MAQTMVAPPTTWTAGRRKSDGKPFYYIPGSDSDAVYMTAVDGCTCPSARHSRTGDCKHQAAVRQYTVAAQPVREVRGRYDSLYPQCGTDGCDDLAELRGFCDRCASEREWQQQRSSRLERFRAQGAAIGAATVPFALNPFAE